MFLQFIFRIYLVEINNSINVLFARDIIILECLEFGLFKCIHLSLSVSSI